MSNAARLTWQFPRNEADKVLGWRSDGKGMENKGPFVAPGDLATVATTGDYDDLTNRPILSNLATIAAVQADVPLSDPEWYQTAGYAAAGDGGGALYKKVLSEPSHAGKGQNGNGTWYEIADPIINVLSLGADPTGVSSVSSVAAAALTVGRPVHFPAGTFHFATAVNPPAGANIVITGEHRTRTRWTANQGIVPILCSRNPTTGTRISGFSISGIDFDGQAVRATFPYTSLSDYSSYGMLQAFNIRFDGDADPADVIIEKCTFRNIPNVPFWSSNIKGSLIVQDNVFERTKDAGILYAENIKYTNNTVRFSADNGVSISRQNKRIHVAGNDFFASQNLGIFFGGISLTPSGDLTISGAAYTNGSTLTLTMSNQAEGWTVEDINSTIHVSASGVDSVIRVVSVASTTVATGIALLNVPAAHQNTLISAANWAIGPQVGSSQGSVHDNTVMCCGSSGMWGSLGTSNLHIHDNTVIGSGIHIDSEVSTKGTAVSGSTTLTLADATGFAIGNWVAMFSQRTNEDWFFAEITNVAGNVLTLATAAPRTLANLDTYRAVKMTGSNFGILLSGMYISSGYLKYNEKLNIHDNLILDCGDGGIRLGSSSGSGRRSKIHDNIIRYENPNVAIAAAPGILITEHSTNMRCSDIQVYHNLITMPTGASTIGVRYDPIDTSDTSLIHLGPNRITAADTLYRVRETTGLTDITSKYNVNNETTRQGDSLRVAEMFAGSGWVAGNVVSNDMTVTNTLMSLSAAATINVLRVPADTANRPFFFLRNASSTDSITLTHSAGLRCPNATNVTIGPREMKLIVMIDATTAQVEGV
ncbi:glycosyl hydrolase family 28-related protein [Neoaquamicrobium sediminum]|uniref:glycosyl hydrolase family 28-related protein n=1 Tax=Neoaquamicrobium sediminum TaxID=1849104 RepID=UPI0015649DBE|nr:right-handed parallel beta-helix repeat-containing protein [Mesorhizobium sediminum]NRC55167.1 hypothetical protein [Mesorhizobium sediminum]